VKGLLLGELITQKLTQHHHEFHGGLGRDKQGNASVRCELNQPVVEDVAFGQNDAGKREFQQVVERFFLCFLTHVGQIPALRITQQLNALVGKKLEITSQYQTWPVKTAFRYLPAFKINRIQSPNRYSNRRVQLTYHERDGNRLLLKNLGLTTHNEF